MECPKCGYERQPEDTHCELCGVDFGLLERQAEEKKRMKQGLKPAVKKPSEPMLEMEVEETEAVGQESGPSGECPKCGAGRRANDVECPRCGVIYKKHEQMLVQQQAETEAAKRAEEKRLQEKKAQLQREAQEAIAEAKARRAAEARKRIEKDQESEAQKSKPKEETATTQTKADTLHKMVDRIKGNTRKIKMYASLVFLVFALGWAAVTLVRNWQVGVERERLASRQR